MRIALLSLLALTGCSYQVAGLTMASNRSLPLKMEILQQGVTGERCKVEWTMGLRPTVDEAMAAALSKVPEANAIANLRAENTSYYLLLFYRNCLSVTGDAVKISGN